MYIILSNSSNKTAVIKDKTEIAGYIDVPVRTVRKLLKESNRVEIGDYIVIYPDYIQTKSNSGGRREKKSNWECHS
jgi:hypothetical protein